MELLRIFSRNLLKTSKKCRKSKFCINFGKIMEKHRGNFKLLILRKLWRILKMFLTSFSEIVKKFRKKVGNILYKFLNILMEIEWHFLVNFWKNLWKIIRKIWKILNGLCFLQECSYHSWLSKIFPHVKSADVSVFIETRKFKNKAICS